MTAIFRYGEENGFFGRLLPGLLTGLVLTAVSSCATDDGEIADIAPPDPIVQEEEVAVPESAAPAESRVPPPAVVEEPLDTNTPRPRVYTHWENYTKENGLPSNKVFCLAVDGDRVWFGTENGLALYENGTWTTFTEEDGLAFNAILSIAVDHESRDLWIGTMGGLNRYSAGRFTTFTQFNSGLPNDVIFGVCVENQNVWAATTAGVGRFRVRDKAWDVYTPANCPQHEPWGYSVDYNDGKVWAALWGGGVLEFDVERESWKDYRDPDGEMEIDLFRDDGIIHDITTAASYRDGLLWVSTYFGLSRYDGRRWRGYMDHDSGLASNFVNFVKARGPVAWVCTDKGLSVVHGRSNQWVAYVPIHGPMEGDRGWEARLFNDGALIEKRALKNGLANNFVLGVDFQGDDVWVATSNGVSRGIWDSSPPERSPGE